MVRRHAGGTGATPAASAAPAAGAARDSETGQRRRDSGRAHDGVGELVAAAERHRRTESPGEVQSGQGSENACGCPRCDPHQVRM